VYFVPRTKNRVGVFDPVTETFSLVMSFTIAGNGNYNTGVLAPNGKIYLVPNKDANVGVFDPSTETFSVSKP